MDSGNHDQNHLRNNAGAFPLGRDGLLDLNFQVPCMNVFENNQGLVVTGLLDFSTGVIVQDGGIVASSDPQANNDGRRQPRDTSEAAERSALRRQRRKIKNRESAARSRAKKQAYDELLEQKIIRLEAENQSLRKRKELMMRLYSNPKMEPRHQLRRTNSAP